MAILPSERYRKLWLPILPPFPQSLSAGGHPLQQPEKKTCCAAFVDLHWSGPLSGQMSPQQIKKKCNIRCIEISPEERAVSCQLGQGLPGYNWREFHRSKMFFDTHGYISI